MQGINGMEIWFFKKMTKNDKIYQRPRKRIKFIKLEMKRETLQQIGRYL